MKYIDDYLEYLNYIKKHSEHTINNYRIDLLEFYNFTNKEILNIDKLIVNKYMQYLYDRDVSKKTIARRLSSLRSFYNYLYKNAIVSKNYWTGIKNPKKENSLPKFVKDIDIDKMFNIPDIRRPIGQRNLLIIRMLYATGVRVSELVNKLVKDIDIDKMFLIPDKRSPLGQRNLLIIRMLYATGVRVSELVNIKLSDIDINERTIRILGKGEKERIVVFGNNTKEILELYLSDGRNKLNNNNSYLFLNKNGNRLSDRYVRNIINDIIFKASIQISVSPHMLRHTFATDMLNNGADLVSVKDLLGHESLNTTSIYTHVSDDKIREIYNKAHPRA